MSLKTDPDSAADGLAVESSSAVASSPAGSAASSLRVTRSWSLAARLTAWYALSAFMLILLATVLLYWALSSHLDDGYDQFLVDKIHLLSAILQQDGASQLKLRREIGEGGTSRQYAGVAVRILDGQGELLIESPGMAKTLPASRFGPPLSTAGNPIESGQTVKANNGNVYRVMSIQVASPSDSQVWTIQVALSKQPETRMLAEFRRTLYILLIVALLVCAVVGYEIARQGIRPIEAISAAARRVRSTTLHERIERPGLPAELSDLADSFNSMLDRLEGAFDRLNRFSADIAHELRTPVNNLRGQTEVALSRDRSPEAYRQTLDSCLEESIRLSRIIDSLLFLARAENPRGQLHTESLGILQELQSVQEFYEAAASEAGVKMKVVAPPELHLQADRTLLQRAVGNLVGNALRHTPPGGQILLSATELEGRMIRIQISDTGGGISPEHLPHVLDRFYRADRSRSSLGAQSGGHVGLGLAIVASIAAMHGGSVNIQSELGKGTRVMLDLPAAPQATDAEPPAEAEAGASAQGASAQA